MNDNYYAYCYLLIGLGYSMGYLNRLIEEKNVYEAQDILPMILTIFLYPYMILRACAISLQPVYNEEEEQSEDYTS